MFSKASHFSAFFFFFFFNGISNFHLQLTQTSCIWQTLQDMLAFSALTLSRKLSVKYHVVTVSERVLLFCGLVGLIVQLRCLFFIYDRYSLIVSEYITCPVSSFIGSDQQCCSVCELASLVARCVEFFSRGTCSQLLILLQ